MDFTDENILLFAALFKGRDDVFARRWERSDKSGYSPAYDFNQEDYARHKALGGTFNDFPDKQYAKLDAGVIKAHLSGKIIVGIYPLLPDNTSWFIAVDFDEQVWQEEILRFREQCRLHDLPAYVERSRSGNGGHAWLFLDAPYPAVKSRLIIKHLLRLSGVLDKGASGSFDRSFPNQDYLSGKGLGNLIALPFQGTALKQGNTAFLNDPPFEPAPSQWDFLKTVERTRTLFLDKLWLEISHDGILPVSAIKQVTAEQQAFTITLSNQVSINRADWLPETIAFLKDSLRVNNPGYYIRKATGRSTLGISSSETSLQEDERQLIFPRGFIGAFLKHCRQHKIPFHLNDCRKKLPGTSFHFKGALRDYQLPVLGAVARKDFGVIVLPPGSGKTIIGLAIIAQQGQPCLIIVHRRQLFDQWIERIQSFLGIARHKIGRIKNGRVDIGEQVTVAMIQSLHKPEARTLAAHAFGLILVDECHHVPALMYRDVLQHLQTWYLYGLTATPIRKNKDEQHIYQQLGGLLYELPAKAHLPGEKGLYIHLRDTDFRVPFHAATDDAETLFQILIHDTERNNLIADDVKREVDRSRTVLVLTERRAHLDVLNQYLKQDCETVVLSGEDSETSRKAKLGMIEEGRFQVLITTGQFLGEGMDFDALDCLVLAYPCAFEGKLVQYIGRVQRGVAIPVIYDYRDLHIPYLENMFRQRNRYYSKLQEASLIRVHEEHLLRFAEDRFYFGNAVNALPLSVLDLEPDIESFRPGIVWKIRVLNHDEATGSVFAEILDYNAAQSPHEEQLSLSLLSVEKVKFRSVDTAGLLTSVVLKKTSLPTLSVTGNSCLTFEKSLKILFKKIWFSNGCVIIPYYFAALKKDMQLSIANPVIRPEFGAVSDYFSKALKLKSITVQVSIKYSKQPWSIISSEAASEEIAAIDAAMIDNVRFEFVHKKFGKDRPDNKVAVMQTFSQLQENDSGVRALIADEEALMQQLLSVETTRHYKQLRHLAAHHEAAILRVRFVLQPFSFLFLLSGEKQYYIVWETLDTEEATYIWHIEKSKEALRDAICGIEAALTEMKKTGRMEYLKKDVANFSKIVHDYSDVNRGFIMWKGMLEERLV